MYIEHINIKIMRILVANCYTELPGTHLDKSKDTAGTDVQKCKKIRWNYTRILLQNFPDFE